VSGDPRETTGLGWLQKTPLVSLLFAVAIAAVPFLLGEPSTGSGARFDDARQAARDYFVRNPALDVDSVGALLLDAAWLSEARAAGEDAASESDVRLPPRLQARSQARLDSLIDEAYAARLGTDPAWRLGVLDLRTPGRNYIAHAFVHETMVAVGLCIAVLLLVGMPLERSWGSPIFALFVLTAIPVTAQAYRVLDGSSGVPWSGSAGLAGALLGAYFIRSLGGQLPLPGWVLLPAWIATEAFVVRGFWIDDPGSMPWATLCAAVGLGAATSGALRLLNVEARVDSIAASRRSAGPNPVVVRAARMRSDGDPYQAFDLIQTAWREDPEDRDVCEAFFSIAVEVGQPEAASEAILPSLQSALRKGEFTRAVDYWFPLATRRCEVALEPTAFVRLGEALLDASHPEEALFSLQSGIDAGVSSAGAARIVNIARDLDPTLTRTAAEIALADPSIEGNLREELQRLVASEAGPPPAASPPPPPESRSPLDRRAQAEHQTVETTAFPLELDTDVEPAPSDANEEAFAAQALDTGALSAGHLGSDGAANPGVGPVDSGDVLSHWNAPSALAADVPKAATEPMREEAFFEVDDLETPESGLDFGLGDVGADQVDPQDDETDSDLTPLMDATDELTSPLAGQGEEDTSTAVFGSSEAPAPTSPDAPTAFFDPHDGAEAKTAFLDVSDDEARTAFLDVPDDEARTAFLDVPDDEARTAFLDVPDDEARTAFLDAPEDEARTAFLEAPDDEARTAFFTAPADDPTPVASAADDATPIAPATPEIAFGQSAVEQETADALVAPAPAAATTVLARRALKAVAAIPVTVGDDWIEIDADGRGKSRLPLHRIQAIGIGAVEGLGSRPVLVIDFVLNWTGDAGEPLKSIRVRSDRFDPMAFSPGAANPLEALTRWIGSLESRTAATCLPNREILAGAFGRFADLATYERDVLLAETPR